MSRNHADDVEDMGNTACIVDPLVKDIAYAVGAPTRSPHNKRFLITLQANGQPVQVLLDTGGNPFCVPSQHCQAQRQYVEEVRSMEKTRAPHFYTIYHESDNTQAHTGIGKVVGGCLLVFSRPKPHLQSQKTIRPPTNRKRKTHPSSNLLRVGGRESCLQTTGEKLRRVLEKYNI